MNREKAKQWAELFTALAEGKTIERQMINAATDSYRWVQVDSITTIEELENYRIMQEAQDPQDYELALKQEYQRGYKNGKQEVLDKVGDLIANIDAKQEHERRMAQFNALYKSVMGGK